MERNKKDVRMIHYCFKCGSALTKNPRDYYNCLSCGITGSLEEMESKAKTYNSRIINDVYSRYGKGSAKRPMPIFLQNTYQAVGVDLRKCELQKAI
jgi:DNA-directed RNA polymerase subunit M/transcription elongation factor TFIIS